MATTWTPELIHRRRWWTLLTLCLSLTVISIDNTILNVALPSIVESVGASQSQLQWIIDSYTIVFACLLLTMGALGDRWGRRTLLAIGLLVFGTCSALASTAGSANVLILFRGLMGIGGAMIFPSTLSILTNTFEGPERAKAIGVWAGVAGLGVAIGPLAGGFLLNHFWWGSVFLINVPICLAAVVLGRFLVPPSKSNEQGHGLDPVGAGLSIVALVGILYGIIEVPDKGWADPSVIGALIVGIAFLGAFIWWETHTKDPMLDVRLFRNPRFSAASATITLNYFALFGSTFLIVQYFQFVLGYSPLKAGVMTAPVAIGLMLASTVAHRFVARFGTTKVVVAGLSISTTVLLLYGVEALVSSVAGGMIIRGIFGIGMGLTVPPATESIMGALPKDRAGVGSAVNDTTRQTGGALGVAVIGSVFAWRYHAGLGGLEGLPTTATDAAHDSIGKALGVAGQLPVEQATKLLDVANTAYFSGLRTGVWLGAAILAGTAVFAWRCLPSTAATPDDDIDLRAEERELASVDDGIL